MIILADTPGVQPGLAPEQEASLRTSARMYAAQRCHPGPKLHVTLRKAFGFGSSVMAHNAFDGPTMVLALPLATVGAMPAKGAASASKASAETTEALVGHEVTGVWKQADGLSYDDVALPGEVRRRLIAALRLSLGGRRSEPPPPVQRIGHLP